MRLSKTEHRATKRTKAAPKFQSLTFDWPPFNAAMIHVTRCGSSHPWRIKPQFIFKPTCLDSAQYPYEKAGTMFCHGVGIRVSLASAITIIMGCTSVHVIF
jgi:hypothetical protein